LGGLIPDALPAAPEENKRQVFLFFVTADETVPTVCLQLRRLARNAGYADA